jgi:hypothetical protein
VIVCSYSKGAIERRAFWLIEGATHVLVQYLSADKDLSMQLDEFQTEEVMASDFDKSNSSQDEIMNTNATTPNQQSDIFSSAGGGLSVSDINEMLISPMKSKEHQNELSMLISQTTSISPQINSGI